MPLIPSASVKTKVDFTRSRFEWKRQFQVSPTANIVEEGSLLQRIISPAGIDEVVTLGSIGAGHRVAGISLQSRITATTFTAVEDIVVPRITPFTVQLAHTTLANAGGFGEATFWDYDLTPPATLVAIAGAPVSNTSVTTPINGLLVFHADQARQHIRATYRYVLTSIERDELLRQSHVNRGAEDQFGLMTVAVGHCVIYTTMYLATTIYAVGDVVTMDDGGLVSKVGASTNVGTVISLPTPSDPYLGVEYITPA
jgi:hypothetical protein